MLPGFRFLFTAIILSTSVLIFGLGAAALLRAAHEEFANLPSRRAAPEPMFARQTDDSLPTLALLRVDTPVADKPTESVPAAAIPEAAADNPVTIGQTPDAGTAEPEKLAALKTAEPVQAEAANETAKETAKEAATPEPPAQEASAQTPPAAAPTPEAPAVQAEAKLAAIAETPQPSAVATSSPAEPATAAASPEDSPAAPRIATLGGPAVVVDEKTSAVTTEAKPDRNALKKRAAERARERRQLAARRARLAREATLQQQQLLANPFTQFQTPRATR
ncbi:hypothetical protein CQ12_30490 [Bradyrhizobium jicamae]|uniref:Uncharacterized protein n=1 Tax=Bradyrhizobium jicamae TaxID=280332 RepID=A0A0R3LP21_9BRAD|nr:hypothetical protein [Bradyrhizobium jicamae]KRR07107.1 hypothetical protein CQ12_30490 [Bradyrhizobium jicamae]